eukprot:12653723-Alexandrium_andersonii.AAC.1
MSEFEAARPTPTLLIPDSPPKIPESWLAEAPPMEKGLEALSASAPSLSWQSFLQKVIHGDTGGMDPFAEKAVHAAESLNAV